MLLLLFLSHVFPGPPVRPHGWQNRTDATPYLGSQDVKADAAPRAADPLPETLGETPGWEVHVRTTPGASADDWRAKITVQAQPITFRAHQTAWPADDWVWYQMLGRVHVLESGTVGLGLAFRTGDAGVGCFGQMIVGGAEAVRVDLPDFFARRRADDPSTPELIFTGNTYLKAGTYDAVVSVGCHPTTIGKRVPAARLAAWHDSAFFVAIKTPQDAAFRPIRSSEISSVHRR